MSLSILINHAPGRGTAMLDDMLAELSPWPMHVHDTAYPGTFLERKIPWALTQWRWAASQPTTHHLFLDDDVRLCPRFLDVLSAMMQAPGDVPAIGLLSNHPRAPALAAEGHRFYRTSNWLVGPAYVLRHDVMVDLLAWYEALPLGAEGEEGTKGRNHDGCINYFLSTHGHTTLHTLPGLIEHDPENMGSTNATHGHGDQYSRERISWRGVKAPGGGLIAPVGYDPPSMCRAAWWDTGHEPDLLPVSE